MRAVAARPRTIATPAERSAIDREIPRGMEGIAVSDLIARLAGEVAPRTIRRVLHTGFDTGAYSRDPRLRVRHDTGA